MTAGSPKAYFDQDDGHGRVLKVLARTDGRAAVQIKDATGIGMTLGSWIADPTVAPDLCRAIFEAAGQVPPVMPERREPGVDDDGEFELAAILARHPGATFPELARAILADGRFGRRGDSP